MTEEKLNRVLPMMFRRVKVPPRAKEELRCRLFGVSGAIALSDNDLSYIAAAGDILKSEQNKDNNQ